MNVNVISTQLSASTSADVAAVQVFPSTPQSWMDLLPVLVPVLMVQLALAAWLVSAGFKRRGGARVATSVTTTALCSATQESLGLKLWSSQVGENWPAKIQVMRGVIAVKMACLAACIGCAYSIALAASPLAGSVYPARWITALVALAFLLLIFVLSGWLMPMVLEHLANYAVYHAPTRAQLVVVVRIPVLGITRVACIPTGRLGSYRRKSMFPICMIPSCCRAWPWSITVLDESGRSITSIEVLSNSQGVDEVIDILTGIPAASAATHLV